MGETWYLGDWLNNMFTTNNALRTIINHNLKGVYIPTLPPNWVIGLSLNTIDRDGNGISELSSTTGYNRISVPRNNSSWSEPINGKIYNLVDLVFPNIIGAENQEIKSVFITTSFTNQALDVWYVFNLNPPIVLKHNTIIKIPNGAIVIERKGG